MITTFNEFWRQLKKSQRGAIVALYEAVEQASAIMNVHSDYAQASVDFLELVAENGDLADPMAADFVNYMEQTHGFLHLEGMENHEAFCRLYEYLCGEANDDFVLGE